MALIHITFEVYSALAFINGVLLTNRVLILRFQLLAVYVLLVHNCGECRIWSSGLEPMTVGFTGRRRLYHYTTSSPLSHLNFQECLCGNPNCHKLPISLEKPLNRRFRQKVQVPKLPEQRPQRGQEYRLRPLLEVPKVDYRLRDLVQQVDVVRHSPI
jgi:hypothetical protein